jgi:hypothetical protein
VTSSDSDIGRPARPAFLRHMFTPGRSLLAVAIVPLLLVGAAVRLAPLTSDRRTTAAISEDGYLMLTVARNIALGRSLTIADGTIPTNGVQPLVTFAWAGLHWLFDSERLAALRAVIIVQFAVALVTALFVALLARDAFRDQAWRDSGALLAASLWFASPLALSHTSNGLETGPYVCAIAAILLIDLRWRARSALRAAVLGAILGLLFLVRNDAVFFILAFLLAALRGNGQAGQERNGDPGPLRRRLGHATIIAAAALAVASPWLMYNARVFGHIVPVSGRAQNLNLEIGESLVAVPHGLAEYAWMVTPLPERLAGGWLWALVTSIVLVGVVAATIRRGRLAGMTLRRWMAILLVHSALLAAYYGVFFGAAYFLPRYLFPLSLIAVLLPIIWVMPPARPSRIERSTGTRGGVPMAAGLTLLVMIAAGRFHARSAVHDHAQVVQWVSEHLTPDTWVGAPQSGTLGYFHDRTINLDGKVNPLALQARRDNRLFQYIVDDTTIEYIADWYGLARWLDRPETVQEERDADLLRRHFAVIVRDPERNLVVLRRLEGLSARPKQIPSP